ncbi:lysozyme [Gluconobacter sp. LMG 1744]|uniref:lysozyme n=1 Tax=Gluconobacter cadivus TaxID=2728101 RepID=UPI001884D283|nr:lysozyme [Gluconobacter cadivus]
MSALDQAVDLITLYEGFRPTPYADVTGTPTVGYGSTIWNGHRVTLTSPQSVTEAEARQQVASAAQHVLTTLQGAVRAPLTDNQWAALTSFTYNVGLTAALGSTLLREVNAGNIASAADQFLRWNLSKGRVIPGLTNRRQKERSVFLGGVNV